MVTLMGLILADVTKEGHKYCPHILMNIRTVVVKIPFRINGNTICP